MSTEVDHLLVAAATLDDGIRWCESTLGLTPSAGGRHERYGTHNRLLNLSSPAFPRCYLEIIAIDPEAPSPPRVRWYGLDDTALQDRLLKDGPRLIHVVARTQTLETHRWGLFNKGMDPGPVVSAGRDTPRGRLAWQIPVRDDGRLLAGGVLPSLIQWDSAHAADQLPDQGARLQSLQLDGLPVIARDLLRLQGVQINPDAEPRLSAVIATPQGEFTLRS